VSGLSDRSVSRLVFGGMDSEEIAGGRARWQARLRRCRSGADFPTRLRVEVDPVYGPPPRHRLPGLRADWLARGVPPSPGGFLRRDYRGGAGLSGSSPASATPIRPTMSVTRAAAAGGGGLVGRLRHAHADGPRLRRPGRLARWGTRVAIDSGPPDMGVPLQRPSPCPPPPQHDLSGRLWARFCCIWWPPIAGRRLSKLDGTLQTESSRSTSAQNECSSRPSPPAADRRPDGPTALARSRATQAAVRPRWYHSANGFRPRRRSWAYTLADCFVFGAGIRRAAWT